MSRLKSLERRNIVLGALIGLLVAFLLLRGGSSDVDDDSLVRVFPDFKVEDARVIELYSPGTEWADASDLKLTMQPDGSWVVTSQFDFPLPPGKEGRLLDAIKSMRTRKLVTTRTETFDKYAAASGFVSVRVLGLGDKELAEFELGKAAEYPEHFARVGKDEDAKILQVTDVTPDMATAELARWVEPRLFAGLLGEQIVRIDIEQPEYKRKIVMAKKGLPKELVGVVVPKADEGDEKQAWWIVEPKGQDARSERVEDLARSFTGVRFTQLAAGSMNAEEEQAAGFTAPQAIVTVWHSAGGPPTKHVLVIGGPAGTDGKSTYVRTANKAWAYEVADYQLADFRRAPEEFVPAPPPAPAAGGSPDGDGEAAGSPDGGEPAPGPLPPAPAPDAPEGGDDGK